MHQKKHKKRKNTMKTEHRGEEEKKTKNPSVGGRILRTIVPKL